MTSPRNASRPDGSEPLPFETQNRPWSVEQRLAYYELLPFVGRHDAARDRLEAERSVLERRIRLASAQGMSNYQIARVTGFSIVTIGRILGSKKGA